MNKPEDMTEGCLHNTKSFGMVKIVKYNGAFDVECEFIDTGFKLKTAAANVRRGQLKDKMKPTVYGIGYFGDGEHVSSVGRKPNPAYKAWQAMMQRCYDESYKRFRPTYEGCSVCNEWHNFQTFADWYDNNHPKDGVKYQLDKDIKIKGNKIYSPDTCLFVTLRENTIEAAAKYYEIISPKGELKKIYNMNDFCHGTDLDPSKMIKVANGKRKSHKGWTKSKLGETK